MRHIINVFLFSIVPEWKNTLQALNFLKMSMFSWIILQFSMVQKNVNVATFGSGNMAVAANPSKVFNPTVVFACATPDLAETTQFLATVFGTTTKSPRIRIHRRPRLQPSFKGDITVLILEKAQKLNHFSPQYLAIRSIQILFDSKASDYVYSFLFPTFVQVICICSLVPVIILKQLF